MEGLQLLITIGDLIIKYGTSAAVNIIKNWTFEGPITQEHINALKLMVPKPETYFEE